MNTENYNKARGEYLDFLMDKWVRAERGRTAAQALSVLGVSKTTWGKWKKGAAIRPANLNTLATFFDVTVDDIQTGGNSSDTEQTRQRLANAIQAIEIVESRLGLELSKKKWRELLELYATLDDEPDELANQIHSRLIEGLQS